MNKQANYLAEQLVLEGLIKLASPTRTPSPEGAHEYSKNQFVDSGAQGEKDTAAYARSNRQRYGETMGNIYRDYNNEMQVLMAKKDKQLAENRAKRDQNRAMIMNEESANTYRRDQLTPRMQYLSALRGMNKLDDGSLRPGFDMSKAVRDTVYTPTPGVPGIFDRNWWGMMFNQDKPVPESINYRG